MQIDLNKYTEFVQGVTSDTSNNMFDFKRRLEELQHQPYRINVPLIMTAAFGLAGEAGEFSEVFKKVLFHGKPYNEETKAHAAKELGDIIWYWTNACKALGIDPNQVIADNVTKLEARYPGGKFDAHYSENRAAGDV